MTRRGARLALFLVFVAAVAAAGWFGVDRVRGYEEDRRAALAFETTSRRVLSALADLRTGLQAYVAPGQDDAFWGPRVARDIRTLRDELGTLRQHTREETGLNDLDAAATAVENVIAISDRAGRLARTGQLSEAARVVLGEGLETLSSAESRVESAWQAERVAFDLRAGATLLDVTYAVAGAATLGVLLMAVLLPTGRRTRVETAMSADVQPTPVGVPATAPSISPSAAAPADGAPATSPEVDREPAESSRRDRRKALELNAMADLCVDFARLIDTQELPGLLERAARLIDAPGFVVWVADATGRELRPALAQGYPPQVLGRMPAIPREADNATAAAWRNAEMQVVKTNGMSPGALVAPLLTPAGCIGALAAELRLGRESSESVRALTRIVAAQISTLVSVPPAAPAAVPAAPVEQQAHA